MYFKCFPISFFIVCVLIFSSCSRATFRTFDKPITFNDDRKALSLEYLRERHGIVTDDISIDPKVVVLHWTVVPTLEQTFHVFDPPRIPMSRENIQSASALNVSSQFLIDRDGTIFKLMPETHFARHVIGLNHCAIGVENIGSDEEPLTKAQLKANVALIRYLKKKYDIQYVIGHYEYQSFIGHPLWKETDPDYLTQKTDPGTAFMKKVRNRIKDLDIAGAP
ncbi:N-acetylmuramoyl-L-alanine amidase [Pararhodonellum marinum]|uniref:N-acetylmuramoyl-L-alanine amidase n=1 Tax=Pararhodonellum marinum TaxID=2755358 RepID=UPI00188FB7FA|nr:peptidoglycan recognition family protein [Pararhodonellum marinum]